MTHLRQLTWGRRNPRQPHCWLCTCTRRRRLPAVTSRSADRRWRKRAVTTSAGARRRATTWSREWAYRRAGRRICWACRQVCVRVVWTWLTRVASAPLYQQSTYFNAYVDNGRRRRYDFWSSIRPSVSTYFARRESCLLNERGFQRNLV